MCGVKGLSVLALRQAVFETCLPKGDRAISLIGAGSKPASALRKLSAFGVSVLSLREMAVTSIDQSNAQGDGGGPAISCRLSRERQIGREDRRKIDMIRRAAGSEPC